MNVNDLSSLDEKQLEELGDALRRLPSQSLARVLRGLTSQSTLPNSVGYHLVMSARQLQQYEELRTLLTAKSSGRQME